jgi:hypothetical protein
MQDRYIFLTKIEIGKDSIYKVTQNKHKKTMTLMKHIFHVWGCSSLNFDLTEKIYTWKLVRKTCLSLLVDQNQSAGVRAHWAPRFVFLLFSP